MRGVDDVPLLVTVLGDEVLSAAAQLAKRFPQRISCTTPKVRGLVQRQTVTYNEVLYWLPFDSGLGVVDRIMLAVFWYPDVVVEGYSAVQSRNLANTRTVKQIYEPLAMLGWTNPWSTTICSKDVRRFRIFTNN